MKDKKRQMLIKRGDDTFSRILAHHSNPEAFPLTEKEEEQLLRWRKVFTYSLAHYSRMEIVKLLMDDGVSQSQAYADIKNSEALYGSVMQANKDFERALFIAGAKDMIKRSIQKGDRKAEGKARDLWGKYGDFVKNDDQKFNPKKLENRKLQIMLPPELVELLQNQGSKGVQDFNKLDVSEIEFEDIEDTEDEPDTED